MRYFNTTGPVRCEEHYCLPPLERFNLVEILELIDQKKYFVLHAPRQTGKTTYLLALMDYLNQTGNYHALYINVEAAQAVGEDVGKALPIILNQLALRSQKFLGDNFLTEQKHHILHEAPYDSLDMALTLWAEAISKPLVLMIDEIDTLVGDTLISVLRQLRSGYDKRPQFFPQSVILCGVRDVRDYRIHSQTEKAIITGGSAFNIKSDSLRLSNFNQVEVQKLYQQHTLETGQVFADGAVDIVWDLTQGQPWLVNALGREACFKMKMSRDITKPITPTIIQTAKDNLILRRETHLDQLTDKLKESRVRQVIEPILSGAGHLEKLREDDIWYVQDLGLISSVGHLKISNPIYHEVIPRALTYTTQVMITEETHWYQTPDGQLDMVKLLTAFQQFFREHSAHWVERFDYKEAGPQLLLQAFLQRIINGGGRIEREYGLGRGRTDLLIVWPYADQMQRIVLELKILYQSLQKTLDQGLHQTWTYMDHCDTDEGHLIIFDRNPNRRWAEKIFKRIEPYQEQEITVWGM